MKYDRPVTPAELSASLQSLINEIRPGEKPVYVDVRPLLNAPPDECFALVGECVERSGGSAVIGWSLWELPSLFVEAEFHAVWRTSEGELLDVAPKQSATERIYFLPDPGRSYQGRQVNNLRRPISQNPLLRRYLWTFDERFFILNRGERQHQHGVIEVSVAEADRIAELEREGHELFLRLRAEIADIGPYSPCPCGSGRKVKWCHGSLVKST